MASQLNPLSIAIVGGGIGGLSLLISFLRHNGDKIVIKPHLYEQAPQFGEIGAGVGFASNAVRAMKAIDPKLHEDYHKIAEMLPISEYGPNGKIAWSHFRMGMKGRSEKNKLQPFDLIYTPYQDNPLHNVHRATFLDLMVDILGAENRAKLVSFGSRLDRVEDLPSGKVRLFFADGSSADHDAVIGCDGVKSRVRRFLYKDAPDCEPTYTGKYAYRGLAPTEAAVSALGEYGREKSMLWGYGGHLVLFPISQGRMLNVVAFHGGVGKSSVWAHGDRWVIPTTIEDALIDFNEWSEPVKKLLALLQKPEQWAIFDLPHLPRYFQDSRVCIIGDAAHATSPHQGAGAAMALEDAACLGRLLATIRRPETRELEKAFEAYDAIRRPRAQKLVSTSRDAGLLYDFEKPDCFDEVETLRTLASTHYKWLWDHDSEDDCVAAVKLMNGNEVSSSKI